MEKCFVGPPPTPQALTAGGGGWNKSIASTPPLVRPPKVDFEAPSSFSALIFLQV